MKTREDPVRYGYILVAFVLASAFKVLAFDLCLLSHAALWPKRNRIRH